MGNYQFWDSEDYTSLAPVKAWVNGVPYEEDIKEQVFNCASLPFVAGIALMPDCHVGKGSTVGSVIATEKAIIPAAVGVDIGCGMVYVRTNIRAEHLPDDLKTIRHDIEAAVPHGRTDNGGANDRGAWGELPLHVYKTVAENVDHAAFLHLVDTHPKLKAWYVRFGRQAGTLGSGNHFIELTIDESGFVGIMLHSGSRGVGNAIGTYFIEKAQQDMKRWFINLPDKDLAYIPEGAEYFGDYMKALAWAQNFARINREIMLESVKKVLTKYFPDLECTSEAINCHHNYVNTEHHGGKNLYITRKGAVRARQGDLGIIPGSMGAKSFIVRGLGNADSFHSCSHGAGRVMSRTQAKKLVTLDEHKLAVKGVECRLDEDVLDETPRAYKDVEAVMRAQTDLVEIVHTVKEV